MKFESFQIHGRGRARKQGFPTINLKIPKGLKIKEGIYVIFFHCLNRKYLGAMHYGPSPAFKDEEVTLEVYLIDESDQSLPNFWKQKITVEIIEYIRPVLDFETKKELIDRINEDVKRVRSHAS